MLSHLPCLIKVDRLIVKCKGQTEALTALAPYFKVLTVFDAFLAISEDLSLKLFREAFPGSS